MSQQDTIFAIDPGPMQSAFVRWDGARIVERSIWSNADLLSRLGGGFNDADVLIVEMVENYGKPAGKDLFETAVMVGAFMNAGAGMVGRFRVLRRTVKYWHCRTMKAGDAEIRAALIGKLGEPGTKDKPGATYGVARDMWAALALAVYWTECEEQQRKVFEYERQAA